MKNDKFGISIDIKKNMVEMIQRFFYNEIEQEIGELKAYTVLDFIMEEFCVDFYNKGVNDAKDFVDVQLQDILALEKIKDRK